MALPMNPKASRVWGVLVLGDEIMDWGRGGEWTEGENLFEEVICHRNLSK
jgi:hypothetical protein